MEGSAAYNTQESTMSSHQRVNEAAGIHQHGPNTRELSETARYRERRLRAHVHYLEMMLGRQYQMIQAILRRWIPAMQAAEANPNVHPVIVDSINQEVVPKEFVAEAHKNYTALCDLKQALNEKIEECDKIREHWQVAVGELSDLKSSQQVFMVDDAEMTAKWNQLQYSIRNFARSYLHNPTPLRELTKAQGALLEQVSPVFEDFINARGRVHLLFQSLLWIHVTESILARPATVWGKDISAAFDTLLGIVHKSKDEYHNWRAQTGGIIQNAKGVDSDREWLLKNRIYSIMKHFISEEKLSDERHGEIIRRSVKRIVDQAIELAVIFNQSRCLYRLRRVAHREHFSPTSMEYDEDCDAPLVDLMVSPGLLKLGNSRGENYDQRLVLAKSRVCSLLPNTHEEEEEREGDIDGSVCMENEDDREKEGDGDLIEI